MKRLLTHVTSPLTLMLQFVLVVTFCGFKHHPGHRQMVGRNCKEQTLRSGVEEGIPPGLGLAYERGGDARRLA